jgi:poly(A) polymerase
LRADGNEPRFVGGCVRDSVVKRPVRDIDIAVQDQPDRVMAMLEAAGLHVIPTGLAHGTVTAIADGRHFEITTLRRDVETDGRHARIAYTSSWYEDAARRDLTMNALFADSQGRIYDFFDGLQDLGHGMVRFVGIPTERIKEDVLRLLRYFRFYAHYGKPPPDPAALAACRIMAPELPKLSGERVGAELLKLMEAHDPAGVLLLMEGTHVLQHLLPDMHQFGRLRVLTWLETTALPPHPEWRPDPIRRLAASLNSDAEAAARVAGRLRLSNADTDRLIALAAPQEAVSPDLDEKARRRLLHRLGADRFRDLVLLAWAGRKAEQARAIPGESQAWARLVAEADAWQPVEFPLKGRDVLDLGVKPGKAVGRLLAEIEAWWEAEDYRPGREACLAKLAELPLTLPASPGPSLSHKERGSTD